MTIVTIKPSDVIGVLPTTEEWMMSYGIPAQFVYELVLDTVRLKATAKMYEGKVDATTTPPTIVIYYDEVPGPDGKPTKAPRSRPPYSFPITDLPPGLEKALRENVKSVTHPNLPGHSFTRTPHP